MKDFIDKLEREQALPRKNWITLISNFTPTDADYLFERARTVSRISTMVTEFLSAD